MPRRRGKGERSLDELLSCTDVRKLHHAIRELETSEDDCVALCKRASGSKVRNRLVKAIGHFARCYCAECMGQAPKLPQMRADEPSIAYLLGRCFLLISDARRHRGNWDGAQEALTQAEQLANLAPDPEAKGGQPLRELQGVIAVCRAALLTAQSRWPEAEAEAVRAFNLFEAHSDDVGKCHALAVRGQTRFDKGDFNAASTDLSAAEVSAPTPRLEARIQATLAHLDYHMGSDQTAKVLLKKARATYEAVGDTAGLARLTRHGGKIEFRRARHLLQRSEELERQAQQQRATERGSYEGQQLRHEIQRCAKASARAVGKASGLFEDSLKKATAAGDTPGVARAYYALAKVYLFADNLGLAAENCRRAEKTFRDLRDLRRAAMCQVTDGVIQAHRDPAAESRGEIEELFDAALQALRRSHDRRHLANCLFDVYEVRLQWEDLGGAADALEEAISVASSMHAQAIVERFRKQRESLQLGSDRWIRLLVEANRAQRALAADKEGIHYFLQGVHHDMANALMPIITKLPELLRDWDGHTNEERRDGVRHAAAASRYLEILLHAILADSKIASGQLQIEFASVPVRALTDSALALMAELLWAQDMTHRCELVNRVDEDLTVRGEAQLLERVFVNVLGNAVKFTARYLKGVPEDEKGKITVAAREVDGHVHITVTDTGTGILAGDIDGVFDMYGQGAALAGRSAGEQYNRGFGIGLAFCVSTLEAHGGTISIDKEHTRHLTEDASRHGTRVNIRLKATQ